MNVHVYMPRYIKADLLKFQHESNQKNQDALHRCNHPMYGTKTHYANTKTEELVDTQSTLYVQKVCGTLL